MWLKSRLRFKIRNQRLLIPWAIFPCSQIADQPEESDSIQPSGSLSLSCTPSSLLPGMGSDVWSNGGWNS